MTFQKSCFDFDGTFWYIFKEVIVGIGPLSSVVGYYWLEMKVIKWIAFTFEGITACTVHMEWQYVGKKGIRFKETLKRNKMWKNCKSFFTRFNKKYDEVQAFLNLDRAVVRG